MAKRAKIKKMNRQEIREHFRTVVKEHEKVFNYRVYEMVKEHSEEKLGKTLEFRDESGTKFLSTAKVVVSSDVMRFEKDTKNHSVKYHIYVAENNTGGKPHKGWHILNYGRKKGAGRFTKPVMFRFRKSLRTKPYSLTVKPFPGYKEDVWGYFQKGDKTPAMKGRNFYYRFVNSNLKNFLSSSGLKNSIEIVGKVKVNKP